MELPEPPECPVCLQPYDDESTTPRVLACGHSACETCLTKLPQPFPQTIRCPGCTQLVKYPHPQGPSALPKNIDLLRLASLLQNPDHENPQNPLNPKKRQSTPISDHHFMPNLWSREFYLTWKDWVIPEDAVVVEFDPDDGLYSLFRGRIVSSSDSWASPVRCLLKGNEGVSLVRVGGSLYENDSLLKYKYVAKILRVLYGMKDGERGELGLILRTSYSKQSGIGKVYGLWYNSGDQGVYIVCERYAGSFPAKLGDWRNGFLGKNEINDLLHSTSFSTISMEICEAVSDLHSEGLFSGCLAINCFKFDDFGHVHIELNEALVMSRRFRRMITESIMCVQKGKEVEISLRNDDALETLAFVSPELLFELLPKDATELGCGSKFAVGYGSDVWSLACVLLWLLIGEPFTELMCNYLCSFVRIPTDGKRPDYAVLYVSWMEKVRTTLEAKLVSELVPLKEILCRCLNFDPVSRPAVIDMWKCIRELIIKPKFDIVVSLTQVVSNNKGHCLFLGELCQLRKETTKIVERLVDGLKEKDDNGREDVDEVGEVRVDRDLFEGLSGGHIKCIDLKGHLDCITGLTVGGGFLFSSSFDKTVRVWSLQDFTHVHTFMGHDYKVMAVVFVDDEQPLCISGDSGGGIYIWGISNPFAQEPIKKLYEQKDWRYSGIHALAISGTGYLYTGSGDKSIKAWSLQDYTLSCIMNGHKSVVSTLAVHNGVLYSGSWDGTVRLWCLSDHSPLTVLGEDAPGNVTSVLSLAAYGDALIVAHENGCLKIWRNDVLLKSKQAHNGAIFAVGMERKWLFTGGWDKVVNVQELLSDEFQIEAAGFGSIACDSVITALLYGQGKLFVGQADRVTKVYYYGS